MTAALEVALRDEWGRLLALLVAQYRRLDLAEDGLGDAFEAAARTWPRDGDPTNPPAWLLTAARRRIVDRLRTESVGARSLPLLAVEAELTEEAQRTMADAGESVVDERLRLVLLCAHPSLPREGAAALTLRLVLGVPTEDIARLFLVSTPTMAARLTRTRKRLAGEHFGVPSGPELAARVSVVADVAYLAFTTGYAPASGGDVLRADVAAEAIRLVRVLRELLPAGFAGYAELDALLALMLLQHSRRGARERDGAVVLLADQDRSRWRHDEIDEAIALLTPLTDAPAAPYLLQALIAVRARHRSLVGWHGLVEDRGPLPGARRADRVARGPAQPGRGGRGGGRSAGRAAAAGRVDAPRAPPAGRPGRAAGAGGAGRRRAHVVRRGHRPVPEPRRAGPPDRASRAAVTSANYRSVAVAACDPAPRRPSRSPHVTPVPAVPDRAGGRAHRAARAARPRPDHGVLVRPRARPGWRRCRRRT